MNVSLEGESPVFRRPLANVVEAVSQLLGWNLLHLRIARRVKPAPLAVKHKDSFRWIWRHVDARGEVDESEESYPLFYECLSAAREKGYQPRFKSS